MTRPTVHLYTACWNEEDMLGFFFRHYDPWVDRYVIYDDGSTDGSRAILEAHPRVELRTLGRSVPGSFCLSHRDMQDQAWKESRGHADWVVVTAIDEHLHHPTLAMNAYLSEQGARGVTLVPALGFDMNHPEMPDDVGLLVQRVVRGRARSAFNKLSLFSPDAIEETGFAPGRHTAAPSGRLCLPQRDEIMLWHYKHLGFERNAAREAEQAVRLGPADRAEGLGQHYFWGRPKLRAFWDAMETESTDLTERDFAPADACIKPLWWNERPDIVRCAGSRSASAEPRIDPKVSVLVKSYNHAGYVQQTIDSILAQSFQDFEIIILDDGSTDATPLILQEYNDARIFLIIGHENRGISAAMNVLVTQARGRYLAILNSDDYAFSTRLERQVQFLDSHSDISAVFALPQAVDDDGRPTTAYNDFSAALELEDFSTRSWLRRFFYFGNCLCAPTAMIRKTAYEKVGAYDLRLHNLQDFDMWVRMTLAGLKIHVLNEFLTAFRIRSSGRNASAPSIENRLRTAIETTQVLKHFTALDDQSLIEIFDLPISVRPHLSLARLALKLGSPQHILFGMQLFYEKSSKVSDYKELIQLAGIIDIFNIELIEKLKRRTADFVNMIHHRDNDALLKNNKTFPAKLVGVERGSPHKYNGRRVKTPYKDEVWLIYHGTRHHIANPTVYDALFASIDLLELASIEEIPLGSSVGEGSCLVRSEISTSIFLVTGSPDFETRKYLIPTYEIFLQFGFDERRVKIIPEIVLGSILLGPEL